MTTKIGLGNCTCKQHVQETVTIHANERERTIERKCHGRKSLLHSENNLNMNAIWPRGRRTHALTGTHNYGATASVSGNPRDTKAQLQLKRPTQIKNDKDKDNGRQTQRHKDKGRGRDRGQGSAHRLAKHFETVRIALETQFHFHATRNREHCATNCCCGIHSTLPVSWASISHPIASAQNFPLGLHKSRTVSRMRIQCAVRRSLASLSSQQVLRVFERFLVQLLKGF